MTLGVEYKGADSINQDFGSSAQLEASNAIEVIAFFNNNYTARLFSSSGLLVAKRAVSTD